jgi:hypothetical protein
MRLFTLCELLRLPHAELFALRADVERQLVEQLCDRQIALANLRLIDRACVRRSKAIKFPTQSDQVSDAKRSRFRWKAITAF